MQERRCVDSDSISIRSKRCTDHRPQGDTSMDIADSYPQGTAQAEEAMEQTPDRVHFQGTASHSMSDQMSAELEYMLAAAPIHKERKVLKARSNKAKLTALRTLQLNRCLGQLIWNMFG